MFESRKQNIKPGTQTFEVFSSLFPKRTFKKIHKTEVRTNNFHEFLPSVFLEIILLIIVYSYEIYDYVLFDIKLNEILVKKYVLIIDIK